MWLCSGDSMCVQRGYGCIQVIYSPTGWFFFIHSFIHSFILSLAKERSVFFLLFPFLFRRGFTPLHTVGTKSVSDECRDLGLKERLSRCGVGWLQINQPLDFSHRCW